MCHISKYNSKVQKVQLVSGTQNNMHVVTIKTSSQTDNVIKKDNKSNR
jgi:hypothetical protein